MFHAHKITKVIISQIVGSETRISKISQSVMTVWREETLWKTRSYGWEDYIRMDLREIVQERCGLDVSGSG
jgi:hypothetical protein